MIYKGYLTKNTDMAKINQANPSQKTKYCVMFLFSDISRHVFKSLVLITGSDLAVTSALC